MIRVAHCVHGLGLGGAQQVIREVMSGVDPRDFSFVVYTPEGGLLQQAYTELGAKVEVIPRRLRWLDPTWVRGLRRAMGRDGIDVVHTHLFGDSLHGYLAARREGIPTAITLHCDFALQSALHRAGYRFLLSRAVHFVACSEYVQRSFELGCRRIGGPIQTIRNGVSIEPARSFEAGDRKRVLGSLGIDPRAVVLAAIGRLEAQKGLEALLDAFAKMKGLPDCADTATQLVLVGDGSLRDSLSARARSLGIENSVVFTGQRGDVPALLPALDVVVFNSVWEGLSIALLEAMEASRCIVATGVPGNTEAVAADREAVITPPGDTEALVAALARVVLDAALRERLGATARARLLADFSAEGMVAQYAQLYRQLAGARGSNREIL